MTATISSKRLGSLLNAIGQPRHVSPPTLVTQPHPTGLSNNFLAWWSRAIGLFLASLPDVSCSTRRLHLTQCLPPIIMPTTLCPTRPSRPAHPGQFSYTRAFIICNSIHTLIPSLRGCRAVFLMVLHEMETRQRHAQPCTLYVTPRYVRIVWPSNNPFGHADTPSLDSMAPFRLGRATQYVPCLILCTYTVAQSFLSVRSQPRFYVPNRRSLTTRKPPWSSTLPPLWQRISILWSHLRRSRRKWKRKWRRKGRVKSRRKWRWKWKLKSPAASRSQGGGGGKVEVEPGVKAEAA